MFSPNIFPTTSNYPDNNILPQQHLPNMNPHPDNNIPPSATPTATASRTTVPSFLRSSAAP